MTKQEFENKIVSHNNEFELLWTKIVKDVNEYKKDNIVTDLTRETNSSKFIDNLCLSGAWIHDRLTDKIRIPGDKSYNKSLSKKIRKALGYTY